MIIFLFILLLLDSLELSIWTQLIEIITLLLTGMQKVVLAEFSKMRFLHVWLQNIEIFFSKY